MRSLSRVQYAVLVGFTAAVTVLLIGTMLGDSVTFQAVLMGLSMTIVYYVLNPNHTG